MTTTPTANLALALPVPGSNEPFSTAKLNANFEAIDAAIGADRASKLGPWIPITLDTTLFDVQAADEVPAVRQVSEGLVERKGLVKIKTGTFPAQANILGQLPAGFAPVYGWVYLPARCSSLTITSSVVLTTQGDVRGEFGATGATWISIAGYHSNVA